MKKKLRLPQKWSGIILIIGISILAYGLMLPWLGFYIDDWTFNWVYQTFGSAGLFSYFSTNRPFWGLLYQLTMPIFQDNILVWQIFGLVTRIFASLSFYWMLCLLWPKKSELTLTAALFFAVYPGFLLQPVALCFGHIWIVYSIFLLSNCFTILAWKDPQRRSPFTVMAVILSLLNVLSMEYFLPLEMLRYALLFYLQSEPQTFFKRAWQAFKTWLPYFIVLIAITIYRAFFFKDQTHIYSLGLMDALKDNFSSGVIKLLQEVGSALYQSVVVAWSQPFQQLVRRFTVNRTYLAVSGIALLAFGLLLYGLHRKVNREERAQRGSVLWIALFALTFAGIPFYVTFLPVQANAVESRFTLPFMVGAVLLLAGLLAYLPLKWLRNGLVALLVAAAVGMNLFNANDYRLMTEKNAEMMYEIAWRAPNLQPGTLIVTNEQSQSLYFTQSTLLAELNLIYPHSDQKQFGWVYARDLASLVQTPSQPGTDIELPIVVQNYHGNTDHLVVFQLNDYGCARFIDAQSWFIPKEINESSLEKISNASDLISSSSSPVRLNQSLIGSEPAHGFCYYFEKADLALQQKDSAAIGQYYQQVQQKNLHTENGYEWAPFIEGLARNGQWQEALTLSQQVIAANPGYDSYPAFICNALNSAASETDEGDAATAVLDTLHCSQ
jgi:hypothetical protein